MRLIIFFTLIITSLQAQHEDNTWVLGYNFERDTYVDIGGGMDLMFNTFPPSIDTINRPTAFATNSAAICHHETGELLFYTNGNYINNKLNRRMVNGDSLMEIDIVGDGRAQSSLILPSPGQDSLFYLIHRKKELVNHPTLPAVNGLCATELYYSIVDLRMDDGLGAVVQREVLLLDERLQNGQFTACRHANGRDWWIVCRQWYGTKLYVFLLDHKGIQLDHIDDTHDLLPYHFGRAEFSPNGEYYVIRSGNFKSKLLHLAIYRFDRCSGTIDTLLTSFYDENIGSSEAGVAFSPNSQIIYASIVDTLLQYDLESVNIENSEEVVAIYDGYLDPFPTYFLFPIYAPNGKIYIAPSNSSLSWHTIHSPDSLGSECRVGQHDFNLPRYNFGTTHNYPHFRLGPIDGSSCDTLGINNSPRALFRFDGGKKHWWFTDLSFYEPESWFWDFGDDKTSTDRLPVHDYDSSGVYEVCLTVSNSNGQDTWCDSLVVDCVTSGVDISALSDIEIVPNPSDGFFQIKHPFERNPIIRIFNSQGERVSFYQNEDRIGLGRSGFYLIQIQVQEGWITKKVVIR